MANSTAEDVLIDRREAMKILGVGSQEFNDAVRNGEIPRPMRIKGTQMLRWRKQDLVLANQNGVGKLKALNGMSVYVIDAENKQPVGIFCAKNTQHLLDMVEEITSPERCIYTHLTPGDGLTIDRCEKVRGSWEIVESYIIGDIRFYNRKWRKISTKVAKPRGLNQ